MHERQDTEFVFGRNALLTYLERMLSDAEEDDQSDASSDLPEVVKVFIAEGLERDSRLQKIDQASRRLRLPVAVCDKRKLDMMLGRDARHQGVAGQLSAVKQLDLREFLEKLKGGKRDLEGNPVVVLLDGIEDPHNLGAIVRVAEASGAKAVLVPQRRSAQVSGTVGKVSAGALAFIPIVKVHNLVNAIEELKKQGFWVAGLDVRDGQDLFSSDLMRPLAIAVGAEGKGLSRLVSEHCDFNVKIPMLGRTESLNASVACGIVLFEVVRQKLSLKT
ncbi:MAG: 23S rRNA (guanosine(2251)-2'-O)-methyltransferase RlmB [Leptolyngbya sp.]|nr:23S rRNA (guanosine(2251)-2'-O)-methyltransferase RlmB [Candidatus Melainabacteria bacterium]